MPLNIPPTLKHSSLLIDSHSLTVAQSPLLPSPRGLIKRSSKTFKQDGGNSEFGQQQGFGMNGDMTITHSKQEKKSMLLMPDSGYGILKKRMCLSSEQQIIRSSNGSLLKKMPLFNQFQQQENQSQLRISQIPKATLKHNKDISQNNHSQHEIQYQLQQKLQKKLSNQLKKSFMNKNNVVGQSQNYYGSQQLLSKQTSQRQINHLIEVINEEQSSSQGNSLNGSRKLQQRVGLKRSLNNYSNSNINNSNNDLRHIVQNSKTSRLKSSKSLEPIMQYDTNFQQKTEHNYQNKITPSQNQSKHTLLRSSSSNIKIHVNYAEEKNNKPTNQNQNQSEQSCQTVQLIQIKNNQKSKLQQKDQQEKSNVTKIRQKLLEIQKSMRMNQDYSMWEGTQMGDSQNQRTGQKQIFVIKNKNQTKNHVDDERKLFDMMNERFKKIKEIKNGGKQAKQEQKKLKQSIMPSKSPTKIQQIVKSFSEKSIQTQKSTQSQYNIRQIHKLYSQQIILLQKQILKLEKQVKVQKQSYDMIQTLKEQLQGENKFLNDKIKRLQRIIQKNQSQLINIKLNINKEKTQKSKPIQWNLKQQQYVHKISSLQNQLFKFTYLFKDQNNKYSNLCTNEFPNILKNQTMPNRNQQKMFKYTDLLRKNMEKLKIEQQKIIKEWKIIYDFVRKNFNRV